MPDATVTDLIEGQAARSPDAVAVVARDGVLTYAELASRADRLASSLRAEGVGPDVVVAVFAERSLDMAVGLWAILKAGGACLTLDISAPAERVAFMLHDSQVPVVLTQRHLGARLANHRARVLWLEEWAPEIPAPGAAGPGPAATPDHLAYLVYTSGSTGRPKGVMLPHGALVSHHRAVRDLYRLQPGDRVLQFCSVSFDVSIEEMFPTWSAGATVVLLDDTVPVLGRPWLQ
ncbi:MAG: AMP-binding protein, partial [Actinomycetota bacterium]|nr:AMP-binding protein [Actinomycetota bacterium]